MALTIRNPEVERLISQLAILTGNTKTGAAGQAARMELDRLKREAGGGNVPAVCVVYSAGGCSVVHAEGSGSTGSGQRSS